ncbi:MAG: acetate--CoA ligase family protein [Candidatus Micrarchaeota archaeon]
MGYEKARHLLERYGISHAHAELTDSKAHALKIAGKLGYPLALKIDSPDIVHKTELGCIETGISNSDTLTEAFDRIMKNARKHTDNINGIIVQKMETGTEVIIGAKRDPQFGPVIMFGLGGILVEYLKDFSIGIAPVSSAKAMHMIKKIKTYPVLEGVRGQKGADTAKIASAISKVSNLMSDCPFISEIDLNPCFASEKTCTAADIRVIVE